MIAQGAEAIVKKVDGHIQKIRPPKIYRHPDLDKTLRRQRMRAEVRMLERCAKHNIPVPKVLSVDEDHMIISMQYIKGKRLRDVLSKKNAQAYAKQLGELLSVMHQHNIVHGDLTTSNIMVEDTLVLIDFGLGYYSKKIEDKAVDLHVLEQAIEATHPDIQIFSTLLENYKHKQIKNRLAAIAKRGRYKMKH